MPKRRKKGLKLRTDTNGFALPMVMAMGMVVLALASASLLVAQGTRNTASQRVTSNASSLVSDSAIARALVQLSKPNNGILLNRNYDPINPATGKNYLGADGVLKSGDETATAVDEWTGYDPSTGPCFRQLDWVAPNIALTGTMGADSSYIIRAYRYDEKQQLGTVLVEGNYGGYVSTVTITISIEPVLDDFPGIIAVGTPTDLPTGKVALRGRTILGSKGNAYFPPLNSADPSLTGISRPDDATRLSYLNALWSGPLDGNNSDRLEGTIFGCQINPWSIPVTPQGLNLGIINTSMTLSGTAGLISSYQVDGIDLANNDTLTVNTTAGPVYIYLPPESRTIVLRNTAKILNIRTDG
jgi:hypothetical protein